MDRAGRRRITATAAASCVLVGLAAVTVALVAGPGPGLTGYVSEAGVVTSGYAGLYRFGIFGLAGGLALVAAALPAVSRPASILLLASAANTALSGSVTCSTGCPLPPFERATTADLVHGGASILAVATCVFAMLALAGTARAGAALRGISALAAALALPLSATVGLTMLVVGRGVLVGVVERVLLGVAALWLLTVALVLTRLSARGLAARAAGGTDAAPPL